MIQDTVFDNLMTGDGTRTVFHVPFSFVSTADVQVYKRVITTGVDTLQTVTTNYTISGNVVTFVTAPLATEYVFFLRSTPKTQAEILFFNVILDQIVVERQLDKTVRMYQELKDEITLLTSYLKDSTDNFTGPAPESDNILAWDSIPNLVQIPLLEATPALASQAEAEAGTDNTKTMTSLRAEQARQNHRDKHLFSKVTESGSGTVLLDSDETNKQVVYTSASGAMTLNLPTLVNGEVKRGRDLYINPTASSATNRTGVIPSTAVGNDLMDGSTTGKKELSSFKDFAHICPVSNRDWQIIGSRDTGSLGGVSNTYTWSTNSTESTTYYRQGAYLRAIGKISLTGAEASKLQWTLPYGLTIDSSAFDQTEDIGVDFGHYLFYDDSITKLIYGVIVGFANSPGQVEFQELNKVAADDRIRTTDVFVAPGAASDWVRFNFSIPVNEYKLGAN